MAAMNHAIQVGGGGGAIGAKGKMPGLVFYEKNQPPDEVDIPGNAFHKKKRIDNHLGPSYLRSKAAADRRKSDVAQAHENFDAPIKGYLTELMALKLDLARKSCEGKEKDKGELKDRLPNTGPNHNRYLGFGHFNDILFRVPFYNLLHPFLCLNADQMLWSQFSVFLNNIGVVLALILALVCTFYSAVGYSEIQSADTRFDFGMEGTYLRTPWDQNYNTAAPTAAGSVFCSHPEAGNCTLGESLTKKCMSPCFQDRIIDWDGTRVSGAYAKWWHKRVAGDSVDVEGHLNFNRTPGARFNSMCFISFGYLCSGLLMTVLALGLAPANNFIEEGNVHSRANALVMWAYTFWMKMYVLVIVLFGVIGFFYFAESLKYMVYIKFSDQWIEENWEDIDADRSIFDSASTYGYVQSCVWAGIYFPIFVMGIFISKGQHSAYTFPMRPHGTFLGITTRYSWAGDFVRRFLCFLCFSAKDSADDAEHMDDDYEAYRMKQVHALTHFLVNKVHLPHTWQVHGSGPRGLAYDMFLTTAAGQNTMSAEVVANALVDVHIDSEEILLEMARDNELKTWIGEVPGISMGAAMHIIRYLQTHE